MKSRPLLFTCGLYAGITFLHLIKVPDAPEAVRDIPYLDKCIHLVMFALLVMTTLRCSLNNQRLGVWQTIYRIIFCLAYAVLMESLQDYLTEFRSFEWGDIAADAGGIIVGWSLARKPILAFFFEHKIWKAA